MTDSKKDNNTNPSSELEEEIIVSEEVDEITETNEANKTDETNKANTVDKTNTTEDSSEPNAPLSAKKAAAIIESNEPISAKEAAEIIEDSTTAPKADTEIIEAETEVEIESEVEPEDSINAQENQTSDDIDSEDEYKETFISRKDRKKLKKAQRAQKSGNHRSFNIIILVFAILALICSGATLALNFTGFFNKVNWATFDQGNTASFEGGTIAEVANRVSPSVVSILTETRVQSWYGQTSTSSAAGTGVIVTKDGYVLTNKHVIEGANKVSIILDNGTTYEPAQVEIIGTDPSNDIAFLKIKDVSDLTAASLGDSKNITIGQQVIAIGNALGMYQNTVTEGIISGTGRTINASDSNGQNVERLTDMIQTDAAINAGNSGGPLVNAAGQVIGINTAVGSGNNLGFAIPISSIKGLLKTIISTGKLQRSYIGVYYESLTPQTAKQYNLEVNAGAYVHNSNGSAVIADSPAAKAGLKDGDVIIRINGAKVGSAGSLGTLIGEYSPGDKISITIIRDKEEKTLELTLANYPTNETQQKN